MSVENEFLKKLVAFRFITENGKSVINVSKIKKCLEKFLKSRWSQNPTKFVIFVTAGPRTAHGNTINLLVHDVNKTEFHGFGSTVHKLTEFITTRLDKQKMRVFISHKSKLILEKNQFNMQK